MEILVHPDPAASTRAAADCLAGWLAGARTLMVAGGGTPLALYAEIARRKLDLRHLTVFVLDEYVGVPPEDPRTCAGLVRRTVVEAWEIPPAQFFAPSGRPAEAPGSIREHERRIRDAGGLDVAILGLGRNGHLGFNEPGSACDSAGRVVPLQEVSVEANRLWFAGDHAPDEGVTVGLATILAARRVLIAAYGDAKGPAVSAMVTGPVGERCPASFLRDHPDAHLFLDAAAARPLGVH